MSVRTYRVREDGCGVLTMPGTGDEFPSPPLSLVFPPQLESKATIMITQATTHHDFSLCPDILNFEGITNTIRKFGLDNTSSAGRQRAE